MSSKTFSHACHLLAIACLAASLPAFGQPRWQAGTLVDEAGLPLYTSNREAALKSDCYGACLNIWVPYKAPENAAAAGDLMVFRRDDGALQWAYRGKALYRWWNDQKPLDGIGMAGGNWQVVKQP